MAVTRITGLTSGMDTDQMVKDLMKAEQARLDKVKKEQTYISWQQSAYRDISVKIRDLQSKYFDSLKASQNLMSTSSFAKFDYSVLSGGSASSAVEVTANADISARNYTIDSISQLATKDTYKGDISGLRGITTSGFDINAFKTTFAADDFNMTLAIGSDSELINLSQAEISAMTSVDDLVSKLNEKISSAFGAEYANVVSNQSGEVKFDQVGTTVRVYDYMDTSLSVGSLGLTSGASSIDYQNKTLNELYGLTDSDLTGLQINGKYFSLSEDDTYLTMRDKINKAELGVSLEYNTLEDRFLLKSTSEGAASSIEFSDANTESFFSKIFNVTDLSDPSLTHDAGQNAVLSINGVSIIQSSNTFTIDGLTYNLKATSASAIDIGIDINKTDIVDNIKKFVEEYNSLIDDVSSKYSEKRYYDYDPLTDDERDALSDDEVEKWEEKAKSGVIRGSSELDAMLTRLRNALIEPVEGVGISLSDIGIKSESYQDKGKLTIDEDKLSEKLETNFDEIVRLFTSQSDQAYLDKTANSTERYKENGLGARLNDIFNDYARTTRDDNGNKGILVNKAGLIDDASIINNELTKKMLDYDDRISDLEDYLADREEYYYTMFANMETAMSKLQSQADSLVNMLGS